jgi:two-component system, cell cycle response regulator
MADDNIRVLLVDDEPVSRRVVQFLLEKEGYVTETASNGEEALAKILTGRFHILLTDWQMPKMDGLALCRHVREANLPGYVYTLILTANSSEQAVVAALEAGADDFLHKPPNKHELLARVMSGARIVRLEQSLREANEKIQKLSLTDPLCGTFNRKYLNEQLVLEMERAKRYSRPLSLIVADLDHFKRVNDEFGHLIGDDVLRHFGSLCMTSMRVNDWVARYGGEEFVIVLPETPLGEASCYAERLRLRVASVAAATSSGAVSITASFGVAEFSAVSGDKTDSGENLLRAADAALYESKRAGRNQVTCAK